MKEQIFNQYAQRVAKLFGITEEQLFSRTKIREIVDARQLLIYLCYKRPMKLVTIETFLNNKGHKINHSTIGHSIKIVDQKITDDRDYRTIISNIENSVFI
jgi:chromosomal replication initiation ATPase DnaA